MRLTLSRAALLALALTMLMAPLALAQDQSQPSSEQPSSQQPSSASPSSEQPAPSGAPADQQAPAAVSPNPPPDKHPRSTEEIYQDLNFFGDVFDRIRSEYVDPPDEQALI